jgi:hypothetical protein
MPDSVSRERKLGSGQEYPYLSHSHRFSVGLGRPRTKKSDSVVVMSGQTEAKTRQIVFESPAR